MVKCIFNPPQYGRGVLRSVCLSVCLSVRKHISGTTRPIFTKFYVHILCRRGSVLLWWRCDTLCTSVFMDDVTFGRIGHMATGGVAIPGRSLMFINAL